MARILAIITAFVLVIVSGVWHGILTARWQPSQAFEIAAARVPAVPMAFGNWKGVDLEVDPQVYAQAGAKSHWMRRYVNKKTGETVSAILMCGPFGPMSVHTPDVCYRGAGYQMSDSKGKYTIDSHALRGAATFWVGDFTKEQFATAGGLRILWAWSVTGDWLAPNDPRFVFHGSPALYKLYVVRDIRSANEPLETDSAVLFLQDLLPQLDRSLFSESAKAREH